MSPASAERQAITDKAVISAILEWLFEEKKVAKLVWWYIKRSGVDAAGMERRERELARWQTELSLRKERLLDALESGKIDADMLRERFDRLEQGWAKLNKERDRQERLKAKSVPIPTVEMFRTIGDELRRRFEMGPPQMAKALLRRLIQRIVVSPEGALNAELVIGTPRGSNGSDDEFATTTDWWPYRDSNPSFSLERAALRRADSER